MGPSSNNVRAELGMGALRGARTRTSYLIVQVGYLRNPPLAVSLTVLQAPS